MIKESRKFQLICYIFIAMTIFKIINSASLDCQPQIPPTKEINQDITVMIPVKSTSGVLEIVMIYNKDGGRNHTVSAILVEGNITDGLWKGIIPAISSIGLLNVYISINDTYGIVIEEGPYQIISLSA